MILVGNSNSGLAASTAAIRGKLTAKALNSALFKHKGHFFLGPQGRDRHRDGAALLDAEVDGNGFRRVGQADAHPVLGLDAQLLEDVGELVGHGQQFFIGDLLVAEEDGDVVARPSFTCLSRNSSAIFHCPEAYCLNSAGAVYSAQSSLGGK